MYILNSYYIHEILQELRAAWMIAIMQEQSTQIIVTRSVWF